MDIRIYGLVMVGAGALNDFPGVCVCSENFMSYFLFELIHGEKKYQRALWAELSLSENVCWRRRTFSTGKSQKINKLKTTRMKMDIKSKVFSSNWDACLKIRITADVTTWSLLKKMSYLAVKINNNSTSYYFMSCLLWPLKRKLHSQSRLWQRITSNIKHLYYKYKKTEVSIFVCTMLCTVCNFFQLLTITLCEQTNKRANEQESRRGREKSKPEANVRIQMHTQTHMY